MGTHTHVYIHICEYICAYMYIDLYVNICISMYVYIYKWMNVCEIKIVVRNTLWMYKHAFHMNGRQLRLISLSFAFSI
jgi:hypothetical protein